MIKNKKYDEELRVLEILLEANRNRGGVTHNEAVRFITIMFDYKFNLNTGQIIKKLLEYNKNLSAPYHVEEVRICSGVNAKFSEPIVIPEEIKEIMNRKESIRFEPNTAMDKELKEMLNALIKLLKQNKKRGGVSSQEAIDFISKVFGKGSYMLKKVIAFGKFCNNPINENLIKKTDQFNVDDNMPLVIPDEYKDNYKENDIRQLSDDIEQSAYEEENTNADIIENELSLSDILRVNKFDTDVVAPVRLFLDSKLLSSALCSIYKTNSANVFDNIISDLISNFGVNFKICVFESDIHKLDSKKSESVNFNLVKFIATADDNIEPFKQERPLEPNAIVEFCQEHKCVLVSGNEKMLGFAILAGVKIYIPKIYKEMTPNPCNGKGVVVIDSNISSQNEIDKICKNYGSIAISNIQFDEIGQGGYLARVCAYYGQIKKVSEVINGSKDRTIVEFCSKIKSDMLFTKDYGCMAFAKINNVPCSFVESAINVESSALKLIKEAKKQNKLSSMHEKSVNLEDVSELSGRTIQLDAFEIYKPLRKGEYRIFVNGFSIEFKNANYKNSQKLENGGIISIRNEQISLLVRVTDIVKGLGTVVSARKLN